METNGIDIYRYLMNIRNILSVDEFGAYIVAKKKRLRGGCRRR